MENLKDIAAFILDETKKYDVDFASCAVAEKALKELNVEVTEFSLLRTLFNQSAGVTVYKNKKRGSVAVNSFDMDELRQVVKDACLAAESSEPDECWQINDSGETGTFTSGPLECDTDKLFDRTKELLDDIARDHKKIHLEGITSDHSYSHSVYMNTFGNCYETKRGSYGYGVSYSGKEGESTSHIYGSGCKLNNLDKPFIECALTKKELSDTEKQAITFPLEEKFLGTAVFTPDTVMDIVFDTILGKFVSDTSLIEDTSIWKNKLGEKVCDNRLTLRLAPHDSRIILGQEYTGEGFISEDFDVIKDGVLQSFCLSQYAANKTGRKRSPNTSSAIICPPGEKSLDEIIKGIEKGIIVGRFSGGSPGANGEFSGIAKNAFLIENGEITKAISETMISDNLSDMLFRLRDISKEVYEDGRCSCPYLAFDGVTISGK